MANRWSETLGRAGRAGSRALVHALGGGERARIIILLASVTDERYARIAEPNCYPRRNHPIAGRSPFSLMDAVVKSDSEP